jgi:hypothetical protein
MGFKNIGVAMSNPPKAVEPSSAGSRGVTEKASIFLQGTEEIPT